MEYFNALMRALIGGVFGVASAFALSPGLAWAAQTWGGGGFSFYLVVIIGAAFGMFAPTIRRAFGRGVLFCGVSLLALPLTMGLLSGKAASDVIAASGDSPVSAMIGAGGGAVLFTGIATFVGLILGAIFVITGLVLTLGGRREVTVVSTKSTRVEPTVFR
jgi:hypothetical protein